MSRKSVSSSVKLAIILINKCLEFYILLVNSKKLRTSQKVLKYTKIMYIFVVGTGSCMV